MQRPVATTMGDFTVIHTEWSRGWGGQEMRTVQEAAALARRGLGVMIVARPECQILGRARDAGLPTHELPMRAAFDPQAILALSRLIRRDRAAIVNTHSSVDSWIGGLAAKATDAKLVRTRHVSIRIRKHLLNFVHRLPDAMITTGEGVRQTLVRDGVLSPQRIVSIPTGVDVSHFAPEPEEKGLRESLGIPDQALIVTTVAVMREKKRHEVLLRALARLAGRIDVYGLLVGEGGYRATIEQQIRDLDLGKRVFLLGHLEDVRPALRSAAVVASTSAGMEGVPQALMQALAMERPVVATDDGSVSELIEHERTGLLVRPEQPEAVAAAIERFVGDPTFAAACGKRGREHVVAHYSVDRMVDAVLSLYETLLS